MRCGELLVESQKYAEAVHDLTKAIEYDPQSCDAYRKRAIAYLHLKQLDKAWVDVKLCKENGGDPGRDFIEELTVAGIPGATTTKQTYSVGEEIVGVKIAPGSAPSSSDLAKLVEIESLHSLDLSGTRIGDAELKAVGQIKYLRELDLSNTAITDAGIETIGVFGTFEYLSVLNLQKTNVTGAGLKKLLGYRRLELLKVSRSQASDAAVDELQGWHPKLHIERQ